MTNIDYEEKLVAFVDVLGFARLVEASGTQATALERVSKLVATDKLFDQFFRDVCDFGKASFFSDSFVVSMRTDQIIYMVREIGYLCRHLFLLGLPCRGAIALGKLYHQDRTVVGPALVVAYKLERDAARFPRVILDDGAVTCWKDEFATEPAHAELETLVKRDSDHQHYLDIFDPGWQAFYGWTEFVPADDTVPSDQAELLAKAIARVERGLDSASTNDIREKYEWLARQLEARAKAARDNDRDPA